MVASALAITRAVVPPVGFTVFMFPVGHTPSSSVKTHLQLVSEILHHIVELQEINFVFLQMMMEYGQLET